MTHFEALCISDMKRSGKNAAVAFERLDSDHKGYVTLDDIMDLLGNDALHSEDMMRQMWGDSMKAVNFSRSQARITYEDFLLLMKGQTRDTECEPSEIVPMKRGLDVSNSQLRVVLEEKADEHSDPEGGSPVGKSAEILATEGGTTPLVPRAADLLDLDDTPLSMDEDDDVTERSGSFVLPSSITPPVTPSRRPIEVISPLRARVEAQPPLSNSTSSPDLAEVAKPSVLAIPKPMPYIRTRSRSYDEKNHSPGAGEFAGHMFAADSRRAVLLPEHTEDISANDGKTALQHNRKLYRAHRQMRLSVMEASKRFEEQQARHAHDVLLAQQAETDSLNKGQAGLVMRRVQNKTVSTEQVRKLLEQNKKEQQSLMEVANRRGGRGRRTRKKTISDIGGMLGSMSQDEMTKISIAAAGDSEGSRLAVPAIIETTEIDPEETNPRGATVPGDFRKVNDPFGAHGKYGRLS